MLKSVCLEFLIGSWLLVCTEDQGRLNQINSSEYFIIQKYSDDGSYTYYTEYDTLLGKWFVNEKCDSLEIRYGADSMFPREYRIKFSISSDSLTTFQLGRHGFVKNIYRKL